MCVPNCHMLCHSPWTSVYDGGYLSVQSLVMRARGSVYQVESLKRADLTHVFDALNTLGSLPWKINKRLLKVIESIWSSGGGVAEIPPRADVPLPVR